MKSEQANRQGFQYQEYKHSGMDQEMLTQTIGWLNDIKKLKASTKDSVIAEFADVLEFLLQENVSLRRRLAEATERGLV